MGTDRGVDLSRRAIKAAKADLEEALGKLAPEKTDDKDSTVTPVFQEGGAVRRLSSDPEAMSGFWPAAYGFQTSAYNGITAVTSAYAGIVTQLESAIELLEQVLKNYDGAELDSSQRSNALKA
ncbi:hypothetical protein [Nonomuraea sp. NPDC049309]|jgi:hypothetical protein|uniref:hypothetical protein n=1 Tax=Nonomuraea sp. NPDC049309 TaxID=3364350 RepID=UPI003720EEB4